MSTVGRRSLCNWFRRIDSDRLLSNSTVTFVLRVAGAVSVFLTYMLFARWVPPDLLGHFVLAQAALWLTASLATLGLTSGANRFIPSAIARGDTDQVTGYISWSRKMVFGSGLICSSAVAAAVFIFDSDFSSPYSQPMLIVAASVPFAALISLNGQIARSLDWFLFASLTVAFLRPFLFLAALAVLFFMVDIKMDAELALKIQLALLVALLLVQFVLLRGKLSTLALTARKNTRPSLWLKTSLTLLVTHLYYSFYIDIHVLVSGLFLVPSDLAVLNAALRTLAIAAFGSAAVGVAFAPKVAQLFADSGLDRLQAAARRAIAVTFWPTLLVLIVLVIFGDTVLALFGSEYVAGHTVLIIATVAQLAIAVATPLVPMLGMTGHQTELFWISLFTALLVVVSHLILTPNFGIIGSAVALVISSLAWSAALYIRVVRDLGINLLWTHKAN